MITRSGHTDRGTRDRARLHFLKSASVPKRPSSSTTERGPAFSPATSLVASLQPNAQEDWTTYNRTLSGERYALAAAITPANAATMQRVCTAPLGERAAFQSGPIAIGGTIYLTTPPRHSHWTQRTARCAGATVTCTSRVPTSTSR